MNEMENLARMKGLLDAIASDWTVARYAGARDGRATARSRCRTRSTSGRQALCRPPFLTQPLTIDLAMESCCVGGSECARTRRHLVQPAEIIRLHS